MKEGAYVLRFGFNKSVRVYYYRKMYNLEVDPNFNVNTTEFLRSPISPSTMVHLTVSDPNFRYCVDHVFEKFEGDLDLMKQDIQCEAFTFNDLMDSNLSKRTLLNHHYDLKSTFTCNWHWQQGINAFNVSLVINQSNYEETEFPYEEKRWFDFNSTSYIPALTCKVDQMLWGGNEKHIKFVIPFNTSDLIRRDSEKFLIPLPHGLSAYWAALAAIPTILVVLVAFCYYRRHISSSRKLRYKGFYILTDSHNRYLFLDHSLNLSRNIKFDFNHIFQVARKHILQKKI